MLSPGAHNHLERSGHPAGAFVLVLGPAMAEPIWEPSRELSLFERRYRARHWLWNHGQEWQRGCGRWATNGSTVTLLRYPDGTVRPEGTQHCMSIWACPVCSARALAQRATRIADLMSKWSAQGGHVALVTLTVAHRRAKQADDKMALKNLWSAAMKAWSRAISGSWLRDQKRYGVELDMGGKRGVKKRIPTIRTVEVTHGANGWHPHIHALVFLPKMSESRAESEAMADDVLATLFGGMVDRWTSSLEAQGYHSLARVQEAHLLRGGDFAADAAEYLSKGVLGGLGAESRAAYLEELDLARKAGAELTRADLKQARKASSRTPFEILDDLASGLDRSPATRAAWQEWVTASRGRRQMSISLGFEQAMGVEPGLDDDKAVFDESDSRSDDWSAATPGAAGCAVRPADIMSITPYGPPELWAVAGRQVLNHLARAPYELAGQFFRGQLSSLPPQIRVLRPIGGPGHLDAALMACSADASALALRRPDVIESLSHSGIDLDC